MKTLLFDMDGVLINSEPVYLDLNNKIYQEIGIDVDEDTHLSSLGVNSEDWWGFVKDNYHVKDYSVSELAQKERSLIKDFFNSSKMQSILFDDLKETLTILKEKKIPTAICSSSSYDVIQTVLNNTGLADYFDLILSGADDIVKNGKPAPDIFLTAAELMHTDPKDCIVIEDSEHGLKAAKEAGMTAVCFLSTPKPIDSSNADVRFSSYSEFLDTIKPYL